MSQDFFEIFPAPCNVLDVAPLPQYAAVALKAAIAVLNLFQVA